MAALVLERPDVDLREETLLFEGPRRDEVLVRILASGICHSDLHMVDGAWGETGPIVLGHEGAGVVEAVGEGVTSPARGDRVILSWLAPCGTCVACLAGRPWLCSGTRALENRLPDGTSRLRRKDGSEVLPYLGVGTFAERTVVPASAAVTVPASVPAEVAALIGCCVSTGVGSVINVARVVEGATVAVIGLGGVGLAVVMGAQLAGAARVIAIDRVPAKLERARGLGATELVLADEPARTEGLVRDLTDGGADYVFEAIGLVGTIEQAVRMLRPGGTAVVVGMTALGQRASFDAFDLADRSLSIVGSNYGQTVAATDFVRYAELYLAGRLPIDLLIDETIRPDEANAALAAMRRGETVRRVIVREG